VPAIKPVAETVNDPVDPADVAEPSLLYTDGFALVDQTMPRSVIAEPPSLVTSAPSVALLLETPVDVGSVMLGEEAAQVVKVASGV